MENADKIQAFRLSWWNQQKSSLLRDSTPFCTVDLSNYCNLTSETEKKSGRKFFMSRIWKWMKIFALLESLIISYDENYGVLKPCSTKNEKGNYKITKNNICCCKHIELIPWGGLMVEMKIVWVYTAIYSPSLRLSSNSPLLLKKTSKQASDFIKQKMMKKN